MTSIFELIGIVGIGLSVVAYLPQMTHLAREHCSAGVSASSWRLWLISSVLIGALATYRRDYVFISLALTSLISAACILVLASRYRGMACATHEAQNKIPAGG